MSTQNIDENYWDEIVEAEMRGNSSDYDVKTETFKQKNFNYKSSTIENARKHIENNTQPSNLSIIRNDALNSSSSIDIIKNETNPKEISGYTTDGNSIVPYTINKQGVFTAISVTKNEQGNIIVNKKDTNDVVEATGGYINQSFDQDTETKSENPEQKSTNNSNISSSLQEQVLKRHYDIPLLPYSPNNEKSAEDILKELKNNADDNFGNVKYSQRVSLNIAPINKIINVSNLMTSNDWSARSNYILGDSGLLRYLFYNTKGIVFPYTPDIDFNHQINYEETSIPHSNLNVQHYKNTPPPSILLSADFTADTLENGLYMYGVIHFLRSVSKCEFGEEVVKDSNKDREGVPPPILYLNGWGNFMINIPVVIKNFGIKLGKNKHYVHIYKPGLNVDVWMPTDITISINMAIQFNLDKYKMKFDLNKYKRGILGTEENSNFATGEKIDFVNDKDIVNFKLYYGTGKSRYEQIRTKHYSSVKSQDVRRFNGSGWTW